MTTCTVARPCMYRCLRGIVAPALVFALLHSLASAAQASIGACSSDRIFLLSNGTELDLSADINTDSSNVLGVSYTLHVPSGVQVLSATGFSLGAAERWSVIADLSPGQYRTITFVTSGVQGVAVHATTQALALIGVAARTSDGYDDQQLEAQVAI
jgi:hypothetical protein